MPLTPFALAAVVWATVFLLMYTRRLYYAAFCLLIAVVAGAPGLEYAPALWFVPEVVFMVRDMFRGPVRVKRDVA